MPSAFTVTNSPVTGAGTLTVTGAGTTAQYIRGDGTLANFPTSTGGGSSFNYYLNGSISQGTFGGDTYYQMSRTPILGAGTDFTRTNGQGNGYIASFITDAGDPSLLNIPGGNWNLEFYFESSASGGGPQFYGEIYKVSAANVFTLVASGSTNPESITNGTTVDQYFTSIPVPQTSLLVTDRIAIRIYVITSGRTITLHTENGNLCEVLTTFSTGLTALNGLTAQVQYLAVGTSGTDFNISSVTDTHTFNLPTASATNRGALSSTDWTTFNSKQDALTNPITGTGTANYLPKFTGTTALGNSLVYDDGTFVGIGTASPSAKLQTAGSLTASGAIARGVYFNNTLVAAANSDVLVGLDITPTFTNGAFTNVSNLALRTNGNVQVRGNTTQFGQVLQVLNTAGSSIFYVRDVGDAFISQTLWLSAQNGSNFISGGQLGITSNTGTVGNQFIRFTHNNGNNAFRILSNSNIELNPVAGNVLIGTTTDAGYKLDVNGTARINSTLSLTNSSFAGTFNFYLSAANIMQASSSNIGTWLQVGGGNRVYIVGQEFYSTARGNQFGNTVGGEAISAVNIIAQSSGTTATTGLSLRYTINNTGTYSGITRGIYYNPTVTSLTGTTHYAIETVVGDLYFGSTSGKVGMGIAPSGTDMLSLGGNINLGAHKLYNGAASDSAGLWFNSNVTNISGYSGISFRSSAAGIQVQSIRMSIFPTGNVAIGTTTDAGYLLDVNGTGIFRDDLTVSKSGVSYINLVSTASNVVLKLNTPAYSSSYIGYNTNGNAPIEFYDYSVSATTFTLSPSTGAATLLSLAGSGTRMVVADGSGTLSTQSIPTGTVTGSGTTNYVSKWSSSSSLSNSLLYDNGTNVGIGTTSPAYLLDVAGTNRSTTFLSTNATSSTGLYITSAAPSSGGAVIRIVKDAPDKQVYQSFESDTLYFGVAANQTGLADIGTKGGVSLVLSTGYSERMRITSGGNVLINTTTDAGYKLDIAGTSRSDLHIFRSNQSAPTADAFIFRPADNTVALGTANTERMRVDSNGNVGIGTTTPYGDLEVTSKTRAWGEGIVVNPSSSGYEAIFFRVEGTSGSSYTGTWAIGKNAGSDPGGEVFQVVKNGLTGGALYRADAPQQWKANGDSIFGFKVGIGTTSPSAKLHIGESGAAAQLWLQRTDGYNPVKLIGGTLLDGNGFKITMNTIDSLAITSGGNVGIGNTAPNQKLELSVGNAVTGGIRINYSASATSEGMDITYLNTGSTVTSFDSRYNSSGAIMQFRMKTAATPVTAMTIFGSGNIAIGTTTDAGYKLDVSGTARIQSTLTVGSTGNSGTINLARASTGGTAGAIIQTNDVTQFYNYQGSGIDFYVAGASTVTRAFVRTTGIGITGTSGGNFTMDASAALQINSTIQGFLPPRMTVAQRTSISSPATGLVVYQTDSVEGLYVYTSSGWKALTMT
jgi:hypothetical protein